MQKRGAILTHIIAGLLWSVAMLQTALADGSVQGYGYFRPLKEPPVQTKPQKKRDRYTAGAGYEVRPIFAPPASPPNAYRYRTTPGLSEPRYSMPRGRVEQTDPRFSPWAGSAGMPIFKGSPPVPSKQGFFSRDSVITPEQIHPGYRFRPQEKKR